MHKELAAMTVRDWSTHPSNTDAQSHECSLSLSGQCSRNLKIILNTRPKQTTNTDARNHQCRLPPCSCVFVKYYILEYKLAYLVQKAQPREEPRLLHSLSRSPPHTQLRIARTTETKRFPGGTQTPNLRSVYVSTIYRSLTELTEWTELSELGSARFRRAQQGLVARETNGAGGSRPGISKV